MNYSSKHNCMPSDLVRLVQTLRAIQVCRGQLPWRYLDLTMAQLKAVMLLGRTGRARSRELADGLGIAPSAATPLVDRLVEQKLARRVDDEDGSPDRLDSPDRKAQAIYDELLHTSQDVLNDVIIEVPAKESQGGQGQHSVIGRCRRARPGEGQAGKIGERGEVAEWSIAAVLKTVEPSRVPGVRIPSSPPVTPW